MVKVTRIGNKQVNNAFRTNQIRRFGSGRTQSSFDLQTKKSQQSNGAQLNSERRASVPRLLEDGASEFEPARLKYGRETYFTSRDLKRYPMVTRLSLGKDKNQIGPNDHQSIEPTMKNDKVSELSNIQSFNTFEENTTTQHAMCGGFPIWILCLATGVIILGIVAIIIADAVVASQISGSLPTTNWVLNGDAEAGSCEASSGIVHPLYWNYNGTITAILYNNTDGDLLYTDPGPSDRGNCYFYGQVSNFTSIWQTVNISGAITSSLIDNQKLSYNFSAWMGGYTTQDDNAQVSLTFLSQSNQQVGSTITIGPVMAAERNNITSLVFHQTIGLVPSGTRSFMVVVTITRAYLSILSPGNDGLADNIAVFLYQ